MNFRQEGEIAMGNPRRRTRGRNPAGPGACRTFVDALEPRTLFTQTFQLPLVNPGFETLYKPGSTTITATIPEETTTEGFGTDFPVEQLSNLQFATVNYSDGTSGHTVTVPGWTVLPIEHGPNYRPVAAVIRDSVAYPGKTDNFASIFYTPDTNNDATQIRQTLVGTTLLPNSQYILSADVSEGGALNLEAGATFLTTGRIRTTAKNQAGFRRTTKTFVTHTNVPAGDITVVLGSGGNSDGDFDNVTLTLVTSNATPVPTPTPTPQLFGVFNGKSHNLKLTEADGTIVTLSMSGGLAYATQNASQIDLQIDPTSAKASVGATAQLGSGTFDLGTVTSSGSLNRLSAKAAILSGTMSIDGSIGSITLGTISGQISANSIGTVHAGAVTGEIYSAASIGALQLGAVTGTLDAAGNITSVSAASLAAATILSGVNLGTGGTAPVATSAALSYGPGSIGTLSVSGSVTIGTVVAAGANPVDGIFGNGNDTGAGTGPIASISIHGLADSTTRFEATAFGRVKFHGKTDSNLASDPRFVTL